MTGLELLKSLMSEDWINEPIIQRAFSNQFGSSAYKPAMDQLRAERPVEHRYFEGEKKFWQYRYAGDRGRLGGHTAPLPGTVRAV